MMHELGILPGAAAVAARYGDLLDGFILDEADAASAAELAARVTLAPTLMRTLDDKTALARVALQAADALRA